MSFPKHGQVEQLDDLRTATVSSTSTAAGGEPRPFPVQVDGDYIGDLPRAQLRVEPSALTVVA